MKYIGIDYGTKKTGIALSDDSGTVAFPREVLLASKHLATVVADIIDKEGVRGAVIGESFSLSGELNVVARDVSVFVEELKSLIGGDIEVYYVDERYTTKQARAVPNEGGARGDVANKRGVGDERVADAQAAALILQSFLDKQANLS